ELRLEVGLARVAARIWQQLQRRGLYFSVDGEAHGVRARHGLWPFYGIAGVDLATFDLGGALPREIPGGALDTGVDRKSGLFQFLWILVVVAAIRFAWNAAQRSHDRS